MKTAILTTKDAEKDRDDILKASSILKNGGLCVIPTETVYGLAADAENEDAVKKIYEAKGRPSDNPLIVHISDISQWADLVEDIPENAKKLAEKFWPGPLTIILKKSKKIPNRTSGGLDTVAVRMPSNPIAREIIRNSCPLAAPSANISGLPSPTSFKYVKDDMYGRVDAICDGGDCEIGVESTVVSFEGSVPVILRPGKITPGEIKDVCGSVKISGAALNPLKSGEKAESPGMKYKHYSPKADVTVVKGNLDEFIDYAQNHTHDGIICFDGEEKYFSGEKTVSFGKKEDPLTTAERLYDALRELDELNVKKAFVRSPSKRGVGLAVCNRLYRAAAFKIVSAYKRPVIGLTGLTGAGKGYVAKYLKSLGCFVSDTDKIARQVVEPGSPVLDKLSAVFGKDIIKNDGTLDRKLLAYRAFSDKLKTEKLDEIMHPAILKISFDEIDDALNEGAKAAVMDASQLFESGADKKCDVVISVLCPEEIRLKRIMDRDSVTEEQAKRRMSAQLDEKFFIDKSDYIVKSYAPYDIKEELKDFTDKYGLT